MPSRQAVGIMILPAAAARFWAASIGGLVVAAVAVAMLSSLSGLLLSCHCSLLSGPDGPAPTYLDMMRHNAKTLVQALST